MKKYPENLTDITTFILDIDGVLTDGSVIIEPTGEQTRTMNIKDGFALQLAIKRGFKVAIISGGKNEIVKKRFNGLGIYDIYTQFMAAFIAMIQHQKTRQEAGSCRVQ